jgi:glycine/sarcosine N-methyltransferase
MYDDFSADYDRFVDWSGRLAVEIPFIERELRKVDARSVLDAACGTGMHTIALAERGLAAVGADLSAGMVKRARANAGAAGVDVRFEVAGFGELARTFAINSSERGSRGFDALLCLGNSLPHLLTHQDLVGALADFAACLRPGGLLLVQNRNFDAVITNRQRWMSPQSHWEGEKEWIFMRFYDFEPSGVLTFNLATLQRGSASPDRGGGPGEWSQRITSTRLWPLRQEELTAMLEAAGFEKITRWGDMQGTSFDACRSSNLVVTTTRATFG